MYINYNGLWKILIDKNMKRTDLTALLHISPTTIAKMGKGQIVSMEIIYKIATKLGVDIGDIVSIKTAEVMKNEKL
ncbi:MAG: helix-turn-helix transcriptional regulator [Clostridia bacterium]